MGLDLLRVSPGVGIAAFVVIALIIGFSKTSLGGLAAVAVAIAAWIMPAKESTAAILVLLITGDLFAVWHYRRDCDWHLLRRLVPMVIPGLLLGAWFLAAVDDTVVRVSIGLMLLVLVALQLLVRLRPATSTAPGSSPARTGLSADHRLVSGTTGAAAGFATMTANSAGAVMTLYLLAQGVEKRRFVGTSAWFFFGINLSKVPLSVGLGLLDWTAVTRALWLLPVIALGAWLGLSLVRRIDQRHFEIAVLAASAVAAAALLV